MEKEKIKQIFLQKLQLEVISSERITKGEFNKVFLVETNNDKFIIRILRNPNWPEIGKRKLLEQFLTQNDIPHAKLLIESRDTEHVENGYMIEEFIEGMNGSDAIESGVITFEKFHRLLGENLSKINSINVKAFGSIISSKETSYKNFIIKKKENLFGRIKDVKLDKKLVQDLKNQIEELINISPTNLKPKLTHLDATPANSILTKNNQIVLIDWDGASGDAWCKDLTTITYWGSHISSKGSLEERRKIILEEITPSYPQLQSPKGLNAFYILEKLNHLIFALELISYYAITLKNAESLEYTLDRIRNLLK